MHRIDSTTRKAHLFGPDKHGFTEGTPGSEAFTETTDDWCDGVQEEIANAIEDQGVTLVKGTRNQLSDIIRKSALMNSLATWDHITIYKDEPLWSLAHDGSDIYVIVGEVTPASDPYIVRTKNSGVTWSEVASALTTALYGVAYNGSDLFCAVGETDGADALIATASDGSSWTKRGTGSLENLNLNDVAHDQSALWCAVGDSDGADAYIETSADGTTWTKRGTGALANLDLLAVAHNGAGLWCAVGGTNTDPYIVTSPDGTTWTRRENGTFPLGEALRAVTYDATLGLWVAGGDNQATDPFLITSPDGTTWTERTITGAANIYSIASDGNGLLLAVGDDTSIHAWMRASIDGITWVEVFPDVAADQGTLYGVLNGDRFWLVCGDDTGTEAVLMMSQRTYF